MQILNLVRTESGEQGTFGKLIVADKVYTTIELPWEDNERSVSCIPYGEYMCTWVDSPRFGMSYEINDVEGRTHILMHAGNWAGDKAAGYRTDSDGCVIIGTERAVIHGQKAVASSKAALARFHEQMSWAPFKLIVSGMDIW